MIEEGFIDEKYKHLAPLYNSKEDLINGLLNFKPLGIRTYDYIKRHVLDYYIYKSDYLSHNITIQSHVAFNFILIIVYNNVLVFLTYDICLTLVIQNGHIMSCQFFPLLF